MLCTKSYLQLCFMQLKYLKNVSTTQKAALKGKETLRYKDFCKGKIQHMKLLQS